MDGEANEAERRATSAFDSTLVTCDGSPCYPQAAQGDCESCMSFDVGPQGSDVEGPFKQHWILLVAAWNTTSPHRGRARHNSESQARRIIRIDRLLIAWSAASGPPGPSASASASPSAIVGTGFGLIDVQGPALHLFAVHPGDGSLSLFL